MFDFTSTIDASGVPDGGFTQLKPGPAVFMVVRGDKARASTGAWMFKLTLSVTDSAGQTTDVKDNLVLTDRALWRIKSFFCSLGMPTDTITPAHWDSCIGKYGSLLIKDEPWTGDDGVERHSNKVDRYMPPAQSAAQQPDQQDAGPADQPASWGGAWGAKPDAA